MGKGIRSKQGYTLIEVLVAAVVVVIALVAVVRLYVFCSFLSEMTGNMTRATSAAQSKMEEIRNYTYTSIASDYASGGAVGNTFNVTNSKGTKMGKGVVYIDSSTSSLLEVKVVVCWQDDKNDRIIGEDTDLDGVLDAGEDLNSNSKIDSIVTLISKIAQK